MDGKKRNCLNKINSLLEMFPVVVILGVRQCGKSTLARQVAPDWKYFDLENHRDYDRISSDPGLFFRENPEHIIIDEAQKGPGIFETLRGVVDRDRDKKGRFILTGSASFELMKNVSESLAGRVATVQLSPFKMNEFEGCEQSSFFDIFESKLSLDHLALIKSLAATTNHSNMKKYLLKGGYPEPVISADEQFHKAWMENYFEQYINRDMRALFPKLDIIKYRRLISMLSSLSGTIINKADLARSIEISEKAVKDYIDIIAGTFFWRSLPAYRSSKIKTALKLSKGHFVDSGLSLFLQNVHTMDELDRFPGLGRTFEGFISEEVIRGIQSKNAYNLQFYHLRTKAGGEIDLLVEGSFGLLPIEIKYSGHVQKKQVKFLQSFVNQHELPFGVVISNCEEVSLISQNIVQVPATLI